MNLANLVIGLFNLQKKLDIKQLPSQGLFYNNDFEISIKRAKIDDINEYQKDYSREDLGSVINKLKRIVRNNTTFSNNYTFDDIKSLDIIFIFLEIVKFTKKKAISLIYNDDTGKQDNVEFSSKYFNYFKLDDKIMQNYDPISKEFNIDGYKFNLPTIGAENCLTNYLISKSGTTDAAKYNNYNYDFIYFVSMKNHLTFQEIDNLIHIFNFDLDAEELKKIRKIIKLFQPIQKYSLKKDNKVIDINSKIDLQNIWK